MSIRELISTKSVRNDYHNDCDGSKNIFGLIASRIFTGKTCQTGHTHNLHPLTMSVSPVFEKQYRSAIALNNLAVCLLERHCEEQAAETFRSALALMRSASNSRSCPCHVSCDDIDLTMHEAAQRFARPMPSRRENIVITFSSVSDDSDFSAALEAASHGCHSSSHGLLIRIEEYGSDCASHRDLNMDCATIIHNFGLSCLALSLSRATAKKEGLKLRKNSFRLLQLSQSILSKSANECEDDTLLERVFFLSLISTRSMAQAMFTEKNNEFRVKQCLEHLSDLKIAAIQFGAFEAHQSQKLAPAA